MRNKNRLVILLVLITLAALGVTVWALFFRTEKPVLAPDYAPVEEDPNARPADDDGSDKMEAPEGGGAVSLTYSDEVTIDLSEQKAGLLFVNPGRSLQDIVIQINVADAAIVQSGTLKPGNQVTSLDLLEGVEGRLQPGGYDGLMTISYYDPDTREKSVVNTEIPVSVTVRE